MHFKDPSFTGKLRMAEMFDIINLEKLQWYITAIFQSR